MHAADQALVRLGRLLRERGYRFTTVTPESHRRVNARPENAVAGSLRDVFGWSRPFSPALLPAEMTAMLEEAECLIVDGALRRSAVRFSTRDEAIFVHSAFPTAAADAVFFGPDTYRYLSLLDRLQPSGGRAVDVGCGSGAGGLHIARRCGEVVLADINDLALRYSAVNAEVNDVGNAPVLRADVLRGIDGDVDLVISNPPYLVDDDARLYRDGGGRFGERLSVEIVRQSLERLRSGGRLILYTATVVVNGVDTFRREIDPLLASRVADVSYAELDPDVFGEELERPAYRDAERIAVIGLDVRIR